MKKYPQQKKTKKAPKKITERYLRNVAKYYLERHIASSDQFRKVLQKRVYKSVRYHHSNTSQKTDGTESELKGKQFLNTLLGSSKWIQTSYSNSFRKNFAGIGYTYDQDRDAFIPPKPDFDSWVLNETTCRWEAPVPYPSDGKVYAWSEANTEWVERTTSG